jgi:hypothetical protein
MTTIVPVTSATSRAVLDDGRKGLKPTTPRYRRAPSLP